MRHHLIPRHGWACLMVLGLVLATTVGATSPARRIDSELRRCQGSGRCNGSYLVWQAGEVLYRGAMGQASADPATRLTPESAFDIGSVTKQFTAAAIVRLAEEDKLRIDAPVVRYLPAFPYPQITLRQLMTNTSGIPDVMPYYTRLILSGKPHGVVDLGDVVDVLARQKQPLAFEPGTRFAYSNTGYAVLAKVIEVTSKRSYADFLRSSFFEPLGMQHTLVRTPGNEASIQPRAYGFKAGSNERARPNDQVPDLFLAGAGGMYSTTDDLLRWALALRDGKVMSHRHWYEATTPVVLNDGSTSPYGFGFNVYISAQGNRRITHGGQWRGFKSDLTFLPDSDAVIIILTNNSQDESVEQTRDLLEEAVVPRVLR